MDAFDAFDTLCGTHSKATALLTAAIDYGELNHADDVVLTILEICLEQMKISQPSWDILEKEICRA